MSQAAHDGSEQIKERHSPPPMHHFERDADEQLQSEVEAYVVISLVQEDVGEETPNLVASLWVIDERRVKRFEIIKVVHGDGIVKIKAHLHQTDDDHE